MREKRERNGEGEEGERRGPGRRVIIIILSQHKWLVFSLSLSH
jgi:hypothetical protein